MASYYFRNTGDTNWGTASNWSLTDGGGATGAVPTSSDDAWFSNNSGNCVVNTTSRNCKELNFTKGTGFTGTFTNTAGLTINNSGNVTLNSGMTFTGAGTFAITTTSTVTTNGVTIACILTLGASGITITLADNLTCSNTLNLGVTGTATYNGSYTIYHTGSTLTAPSACLSSTVTLELQGNVTVSSSGRISLYETKINCGTNTFTLTSFLTIGDVTNTTRFTYVSGKINIGSGAYLSIIGSTILDTYPIEWNVVDMGGGDGAASRTYTLNSPLLVKGMLRSGGIGTTISGHSIIYAGTSGFVCGSFQCAVNNTSRTITFQAGVTYRVRNQAVFNSAQPQQSTSVVSSSSGQKARFLFDKNCTVSVCNFSLTDIDNISPFIVPIFIGTKSTPTLTNSNGWKLIPANTGIVPITNTQQGLNQGINQGLY